MTNRQFFAYTLLVWFFCVIPLMRVLVPHPLDVASLALLLIFTARGMVWASP